MRGAIGPLPGTTLQRSAVGVPAHSREMPAFALLYPEFLPVSDDASTQVILRVGARVPVFPEGLHFSTRSRARSVISTRPCRPHVNTGPLHSPEPGIRYGCCGRGGSCVLIPRGRSDHLQPLRSRERCSQVVPARVSQGLHREATMSERNRSSVRRVPQAASEIGPLQAYLRRPHRRRENRLYCPRARARVRPFSEPACVPSATRRDT